MDSSDDIAASWPDWRIGDLLGALQFGVGALVRVDLLDQQPVCRRVSSSAAPALCCPARNSHATTPDDERERQKNTFQSTFQTSMLFGGTLAGRLQG